MDKEYFGLGGILKTLRNTTNLTTRGLAKKIGYSHSYISSVENEVKLSPSNDFIQQYLLGIFDNDVDDANYYIDLINRLADGTYVFEKLPSSMDSLKANANEEMKKIVQNFSDPHIFSSNKKGKYSESFFEEPINDLNFHLNDINNKKYFRNVEIDNWEMIHINEMINDYLTQIYKTQANQVGAMHINGDIDKTTYDDYMQIISKTLKKLDYDDSLLAEEFKYLKNGGNEKD